MVRRCRFFRLPFFDSTHARRVDVGDTVGEERDARASPRAVERARGWWMTAALCGGVARPSPTEQSAGHSRRRRGVRDRLPTRITYHTLYYTRT